MIEQPISTHATRAMRSVQVLSTVESTAVLPFSSAKASGEAVTPYSVGSTICSSGNARPMPSASSSGSPRAAAAAIGIVEFTPPASAQAMWVTGRPREAASACTGATTSSRLGSFSTMTVGAPIIATVSTRASSGSSSSPTTVTGPCSARA
ncbi:MAG: hypothetical protein K0R81_386 [Microbacterium sp.]|nr:hypothetical protein [Microbacterium sp.]